jgi:VanZ family protein
MYKKGLLILLYNMFLFFLSERTSIPHEPLFLHEDKVVHFLLYLPMGFILAVFLSGFFIQINSYLNFKKFKLRIIFGLYFFFIALFLAIFDEVHQGFVPERTPEIFDIIADLGGCFFGKVIFLKFSVYNRRNNKSN